MTVVAVGIVVINCDVVIFDDNFDPVLCILFVCVCGFFQDER